MPDRDPMEEIRARLWRVASDIKGDDDEVQTRMGHRMRLWALDVAEQCAGLFDVFDETDLTKRVIEFFREQQRYDAEYDEEKLYALADEVTLACRQMVHDEQFDEGLPRLAAARAAVTALRSAVLDPDTEDLRSLAGLLGNVPEQAALALAYGAIDMGMDRLGVDDEERKYFIFRETDDRVEDIVNSMRSDLGALWLRKLNERLDLAPSFKPGP